VMNQTTSAPGREIDSEAVVVAATTVVGCVEKRKMTLRGAARVLGIALDGEARVEAEQSDSVA
jgi:hypothetical protein